MRFGLSGDLTTWIANLANAITRMEGYYPGSRAYRNNNPGNLRDVYSNGRWQIWPNLPHDDQGFPQFPTPAAGRAALERDLTLKVNRGMSLQQIIYAWAPPSDGNNTATYLDNVQAWTGIQDPTMPFREIPTFSTTVYATAPPDVDLAGGGSAAVDWWGAGASADDDSDRTTALAVLAFVVVATAVAMS